MDDRVRELLDRVRATAITMGEAAGSTAWYAGKCAGQMVDVAKLNMKIFDLKRDIDALLCSLGQMVYDTHRGQAADAAQMDQALLEIDAKHAAIGELRERVAVLRHSRACPSCGSLCGREDQFCKHCGIKL